MELAAEFHLLHVRRQWTGLERIQRQRMAWVEGCPVPVGGVHLAEQHHVRQGRQAAADQGAAAAGHMVEGPHHGRLDGRPEAAHLLAQLFGGADLPVAPQMAMQFLQPSLAAMASGEIDSLGQQICQLQGVLVGCG
jgi:hypothetical protein